MEGAGAVKQTTSWERPEIRGLAQIILLLIVPQRTRQSQPQMVDPGTKRGGSGERDAGREGARPGHRASQQPEQHGNSSSTTIFIF